MKWCDVCYCVINSPVKVNEHYKGKPHAVKENNKNKIITYLFDKSNTPFYYCPFCLIINSDQKQLAHHLLGHKHQKFCDIYKIYSNENSDPDKVIINNSSFLISKCKYKVTFF